MSLDISMCSGDGCKRKDPVDWENLLETGDFASVSVHEFNGFGRGLLDSEKEQICNFANKRIRQALEDCPVVYGHGLIHESLISQAGDYFDWNQRKDPEELDTQIGRAHV